ARTLRTFRSAFVSVTVLSVPDRSPYLSIQVNLIGRPRPREQLHVPPRTRPPVLSSPPSALQTGKWSPAKAPSPTGWPDSAAVANPLFELVNPQFSHLNMPPLAALLAVNSFWRNPALKAGISPSGSAQRIGLGP